ncbi:multicopper oxidase-domain-containing protein [Penicillium verhagenii]|uniref:multicopper oxidase-domain-containing protein n=1 Tax=Penicillium verhagenii TaxID=1562060 RepID=UPI0025459732|nr:multicopper oxidase-domain-containing protein [Penicillium verhagenii]KAJ5948165.1 multicopper oxidase-domain-containing protein [Penicillium verhagenii]
MESHRHHHSFRCEEESASVPIVSRSKIRPWATGVLLGALLIALIYLSRPDIYLWGSVSTLQPHHSTLSEAALRPLIKLHHEDHAFRQPATLYMNWNVTKGLRRPDGVLKEIYLLNDLFPGPTVEARSGDTLTIMVTNLMNEESLSIHWHGLHVTNAMDGAAGVSQCPIPPGGQFVYNFTIPADQSGTFWYHAHVGLSRGDGLYGGLVVHAPASRSTVRGLLPRLNGDAYQYGYEKELLLLIGDWYHWSASDVLAWYMNPGNIGLDPVPDSFLINGVGYFNCSGATIARPVDCIDQPLDTLFLKMNPGTTYRIRVVNTGSLMGLSLLFDKEELTLIQMDGVDVETPKQHGVNSMGILYPGQRMDFILHPNQLPVASSMTVQLDQEYFKFMNPSLTPNQTFPINYQISSAPEADSPIPTPGIRNNTDINNTPSTESFLKFLPPKPDQTYVIYTKIQILSFNHNIPFGIFNQTTWSPQKDPSMPLIALPRNQWDENQFAITTGPGPAWIDLVVNNLDDGGHSFHMHGHHFYVMTVQTAGYGWGSYNPFEDAFPPGLAPDRNSETNERLEIGTIRPNTDEFYPYNLSRVALRDTVYIPRRSYAVLRFRADNPGVWLFHCHMLWHVATGMAMLIDVQGDSAGATAHDASLMGSVGGVCAV